MKRAIEMLNKTKAKLYGLRCCVSSGLEPEEELIKEGHNTIFMFL